jgi:hypothetical protein
MAEAVQAFRQITWLIVKWALIITVVVVVLIAASIGIFYAHQWYSYDRHAANVALDINATKQACADDKYPIRVRIMNSSERTLEKTSFSLGARVKGRSTDLVEYQSYEDDHISKPKEGYSACYMVPKLTQPVPDPRELEWFVKYKTFYFAD